MTTDPHDATADELVEIYRAIQGDHPDWEEFRAAMVADRRLVVRLRADRAYGWGRHTGPLSGADYPDRPDVVPLRSACPGRFSLWRHSRTGTPEPPLSRARLKRFERR